MSEAVPEAPACLNSCRGLKRVYSAPTGYRLYLTVSQRSRRGFNCAVSRGIYGSGAGSRTSADFLLLLSPLPLPLVHGLPVYNIVIDIS